MDTVCVFQHKRNHQDICDDRRKACNDQPSVSQFISEIGAGKCRQASADDIRKYCTAHNITDYTAKEKARNRSRRKYRQNRQHFCYSDLHLTKTKRLQKHDKYDINRRNQSGLR